MDWVNAIIQGVLLGGLYALFAAGLSLMFGVMRFVNIAHGDFIVVSAYMALVLAGSFALHPLFSILIVVPLMGVFGYLGQRLMLNRVLGTDILPPILVTFGLSIIIQNALLETFSADSQRLPSGWLEAASFSLGSQVAVGVLPLMMFGAALLIIGLLQYVFYRTQTGRILRATSDDARTVSLMGANNAHTFAVATMLASAVVAVAGVMFAMKTNFDPASGPVRLLFAFEAVIIGGLGNLWGTLIGGIILGVAQTVGAQINPGWQILAGHVVFLVILVIRPTGLFPRMSG